MKECLEIPFKDLKEVTYTNPDHEIDDLEWSFINQISRATGFFLARIKVLQAKKLKHSKEFNYFKFEYDGKIYTLNNGIIKEDNN